MGAGMATRFGHRSRTVWGLAALAGVAAGLGIVGVRLLLAPGAGPSPPESAAVPPSPQLTYQGPFLNVRPEVGYVGNAACATCHREIAGHFKESAMGRSLRPVAEVAAHQRYDRSVNN